MGRVSKLELHRAVTDILNKGDLDTLTTKKIRILCEAKYNVDLSSRKQEIDRSVLKFISRYCGKYETFEIDSSDDDDDDNDEDSSESSENSSDENCSQSSESLSDENCSQSDCSGSSKKISIGLVKVEDMEPKPFQFAVPFPVDKKVDVKNKKYSKTASSQPSKRVATPNRTAKRAKKEKEMSQAELDDAAFARKLQAQEWNLRRGTH